MNLIPDRFGSRRSAQLLGTVCLAAASALAFGLASTASVSEATTNPSTEAEVVAAATAKVETDAFIAQILPPASLEVGKEGYFEITVKPKDGYKINLQYPFKFKLADPPPENVAFTKTVLVRSDREVTLAEKGAVMKFPVTAKTASKVTITGKLSLSVCSDANCVMDKVDLEASIDAR